MCKRLGKSARKEENPVPRLLGRLKRVFMREMKMKAVLCKEFGPPESLVVEDIASPEPGSGEVVLEVHAAAVNFPDVLIIQNKYQFKPPLPFAPGGEVAGVVSKLGDGVKNLKIGDRVIGSCGHGG